MKILLPVIFLLISVNVLAKEVIAPFGLEWGQTKQKLKDKSILLTNCSTEKKITTCQTKKPTKGVSFGDFYVLYIDALKGLQKVTMISKDLDSDISGSAGKALYSKIKTSLTKKYYEPQSYEYIGRELYDEYDEFYQCLKYDGCGQWFSFLEKKIEGTIVLELKGLSRGKGYVSLTYESEKWAGIIDSLKEREKSADDDAL
jgi:hypothetical protein